MSLSKDFAGLPVPLPRPDAVEAGLFGWDAAGPLRPDATEVEALTDEHARELLSVLSDIRWMERCLAQRCDPATGSPPTTAAATHRLKRTPEDLRGLQGHFHAMLSVYADAFGSDAAEDLERFVRTMLDDAPSVQQALF